MAARSSPRVPGASTNRLTPRAAAAVAVLLAVVPLAAAQGREPALEELGGDRYRVSVSIRTDSQPAQYAEAQDELREAARRRCEGHGRARFEGPVEIGSASRGRTALALTFSCAGTESPPAG